MREEEKAAQIKTLLAKTSKILEPTNGIFRFSTVFIQDKTCHSTSTQLNKVFRRYPLTKKYVSAKTSTDKAQLNSYIRIENFGL